MNNCKRCRAELTADYSVKRVYTAKNPEDDIAVAGKYDEDGFFVSEVQISVPDTHDLRDDSDSCINCENII